MPLPIIHLPSVPLITVRHSISSEVQPPPSWNGHLASLGVAATGPVVVGASLRSCAAFTVTFKQLSSGLIKYIAHSHHDASYRDIETAVNGKDFQEYERLPKSWNAFEYYRLTDWRRNNKMDFAPQDAKTDDSMAKFLQKIGTSPRELKSPAQETDGKEPTSQIFALHPADISPYRQYFVAFHLKLSFLSKGKTIDLDELVFQSAAEIKSSTTEAGEEPKKDADKKEPEPDKLITPTPTILTNIKEAASDRPSYWDLSKTRGSALETSFSANMQAAYDVLAARNRKLYDHRTSLYSSYNFKSVNFSSERNDTASTIPFSATFDLNTCRALTFVGIPLNMQLVTNQEFTNVYRLLGLGINRMLVNTHSDMTRNLSDVINAPFIYALYEGTGPVKQYGGSGSFNKNSMTRFHLGFGSKSWDPGNMQYKPLIKSRSKITFDFQADWWINSRRESYQSFQGQTVSTIINNFNEFYGNVGMTVKIGSFFGGSGLRIGYESGASSWAPFGRKHGTFTIGLNSNGGSDESSKSAGKGS